MPPYDPNVLESAVPAEDGDGRLAAEPERAAELGRLAEEAAAAAGEAAAPMEEPLDLVEVLEEALEGAGLV